MIVSTSIAWNIPTAAVSPEKKGIQPSVAFTTGSILSPTQGPIT